MKSKAMFLSLISWGIFTVLAGRGTGMVTVAALLATVAAVVIAVRNTRESGGLKLVDFTGVVTFAAMTAIAFVGDDSVRRHLADYGRGGCALVLALVMLGSTLFVPFSEQYARAQVPSQYWGSPVFRAVNRRISAVWGCAILVMAGGHFVSGYLQAAGELARRQNLLLNWVLPVVLVLGAMRVTERITGANRTSAVQS